MALMERMYAALRPTVWKRLKTTLRPWAYLPFPPPPSAVSLLDAKEQYGESFENDLSCDSTDPL
jgi:hypothetical protein